jgi:uncharacterized DUF497 family protein
MPYYFFIWNDENEEHLAEHGVSIDDFEKIVCDPLGEDVSRTTGRPVAFGLTDDGRRLMCVYELIDDHTVLPITAYEVDA